MRAKDVLKTALKQFDGTLLIVSHDRDFLKGLTNSVMEIKDGDMEVYPGDIAEFLEMKQAASIKAFEYTQKQEASKQKVKGGNEKERWQLSKKTSSIEKEIEKLEIEIETHVSKGESLDYSDEKQSQQFEAKRKVLDNRMNQKLEEWEHISKLLAELED
jgi:ATP-binding cassette subfamily F protein 3